MLAQSVRRMWNQALKGLENGLGVALIGNPELTNIEDFLIAREIRFPTAEHSALQLALRLQKKHGR